MIYECGCALRYDEYGKLRGADDFCRAIEPAFTAVVNAGFSEDAWVTMVQRMKRHYELIQQLAGVS